MKSLIIRAIIAALGLTGFSFIDPDTGMFHPGLFEAIGYAISGIIAMFSKKLKIEDYFTTLVKKIKRAKPDKK